MSQNQTLKKKKQKKRQSSSLVKINRTAELIGKKFNSIKFTIH